MSETLTKEDVQIHVGPAAKDMSHIIDQSRGSGQDVSTAYIEGGEVTALCGYSWVPSRSPAGLPVCPECLRIIEALGRTYLP